jgi:hypothetical protein
MTKLLQQFTKLLAGTANELEAFINSKNPKTHADVEYWTRWYEAHGICRGF